MLFKNQKTINEAFKISGVGLHSGVNADLLIKPAKENSGINFCRVDIDENDLIPLLPNIYQIGNFKYELTPGALSAFYLPQSASGERIYKLVQEQGIDGYKISDGSMLIEYMEGTDTAAIANDFSLELILDFPSVRTASFQASTFSGLNELMSTLTEDDRINLVSLDLIDPSIGPR